jgi:hypothetical protein
LLRRPRDIHQRCPRRRCDVVYLTPIVERHVFIAASLDELIARSDGALDWLMKPPPNGENYGYDAFLASADRLVIGRGSSETVLSFET